MTRILRGLTSEHLACGCVRGVYETYDGRVVTVLDAVGEDCREPGHESGKVDERTASNDAGASGTEASA
jgi:hypothetical protein